MKYPIALSLLIVCLSAFGQSPQNGRFEFYKKIAETAPGLRLTYDCTPSEFEDALANRLSDATGKSPDKVKGDLVAHYALEFPEVSAQKLDYYFRIEELNGQQSQTRVTLFLALGNDNFMDQASYPNEWVAAQSFLTGLRNDINRILLESALEEMEGALSEAEKAMKDLQSESEDLAKEQKKLEEELQKVKESRAENQSALTKQQETLQQLRSQVQALRRQMGNN